MPGRGQKDLFERLIREVKVRESLYNIRHPNYKDRHNTDAMWDEVAVSLGMTVMDAKRLWGTLRSSFTRSVKGALCSATRKTSPWYLEEEMEFLRPHLQLCLPGGKRSTVPSSTQHHTLYGQEIKEEHIVKVEQMSSDSYERRGLEDGEILPEDLVPGAYWITPQFPKRLETSDYFPPKDIAVSVAGASQIPQKYQPTDTGAGYVSSYEKDFMSQSKHPAKIPKLEFKSNIEAPFDMPQCAVETSTCSMEGMACSSSRNDNMQQETCSVKKEDPDNDFFKGIMPRYRELSKKNRRKFEMQTVQLLYSILDAQEEERY